MTLEQLCAKIEEAAAKATELPWETHHHSHCNGEYWSSIGHHGRGPITDIVGAEGNKTEYFQPAAGMKHLVTPVEEQKANAAYIVLAANLLPVLLKVVTAQAIRIACLRTALNEEKIKVLPHLNLIADATLQNDDELAARIDELLKEAGDGLGS